MFANELRFSAVKQYAACVSCLGRRLGYTKWRSAEFATLSALPSTNDISYDSSLAHHLKILSSRFKLEQFKPHQWAAIEATLVEKRDNYINLPTGYGKSLCYQYPAVYTNKLSVVVSPLISLMQDQVRLLGEIGISSCFLASIQEHKEKIIKNLLDRYYNVLYTTPEFVFTNYGMYVLKMLYSKNLIVLFAVDEAHCLMHWGKDFRPSYEKLSVLRRKFPEVPIMALTGTSTYSEMNSIIESLSMKNPQIVCDHLDRPNLYFMVKKMSLEPFGDISSVLSIDAVRHNVAKGSVIIYTLTKISCIKICKLLNVMKFKCQAYHADLSREERQTVLDNFMSNKIKMVVATTAFGLGINKPDIRVIIHYGASLNIESYYQEAGRAGRDNKPALCVLLYSPSNFYTHRYLNYLNSSSSDNFLHSQERNSVMKKYVNLTSCRRSFILSHFNSEEPIQENTISNCCDNCTSKTDDITEPLCDCTNETKLLLKTVESLSPRTYGVKTIIAILQGRKTQKTQYFRNNTSFGAGNNRSETWWKTLAMLLEEEKYIEIDNKYEGKILYSKVIIGEIGKKWLKDCFAKRNEPVYFNLKDE